MNVPSPDTDSSQRDRRVFAILLALYVLVLFPILRANRYYNDDLKRALIGRAGWDSNGRPLTTLLMKLLQCYDRALVDISPLTQIGAIAILAWVGVLVARRHAIRSPWMAALAAFPLGAQPFFLENLSYKFDALSMSLALLLALLPALVLGNDRRGWWLGVLALFASLNFYQSAINACLVFILLDVVMAQLDDKPPREIARRFIWRVLQVGVAMLLYQLVVGLHISGWVKQNSATINPLSELSVIGSNVAAFAQFIGGSFNQQWWRYFGPLLVLLGLVPVAVGLRYVARHRDALPAWGSALLAAGSVLLPLAALAGVLGPMLVLANPPLVPRVLVGVGALLAAALIVLQAALPQWRRSERWSLAAGGMLALGVCTIASAYGNALGEQQAYEDRIAARLADDLAEANAHEPIEAVLLDGTAGHSPLTAHVAEQFPLMNALVLPYLDGSNTFLTPGFLRYYMPDVVARLNSEAVIAQKVALLDAACRTPPLRTTAAYSLHVIERVAVVRLGAAAQRCGAAAGD